ncbi:MAG: hypothetical protein E7E22_09615 [Actinomyces sp.]|jgi:hypothetical protein|nr:hypothetical protein [Actinomyces sp.]
MSTDDVWKRIEHAQLLIDIKRPQQAIEQLATIPLGDPEVSCRVNCLLAHAHLNNRELDKAWACARRAIEASPNNLGALYWLAYLEGDPKLALKYATRLVELAPEHGFSHTMRAHTLARNFQWEEALNAAREGERLDPEDPFALNTLARVLARNDKEAALEVYQRVLSLEPDDVVARQAIADLQDDERTDASSRLYRDLLEQNPGDKIYENKLHWLVFKPLFSFCFGLSIVYLVGWSIVGLVYAFGSRQVALIVGLLWTALFPLPAMDSAVRKHLSKVAAGQGKTRRDVVNLVFKRRPIGATIATISIALLALTPAVFGLVRYFVPASSWWTALGVPILVMLCGWVGALVARYMIFVRER